MKVLKKQSYIYSRNMIPEAHAAPGETVMFEVADCFSGKLKTEDRMPEIADDEFNPITGPLYLDGAEPGDVLAVEIQEIETEDHGWVVTGDRLGIVDHESRIRRIEIRDGFCLFHELKWPVNTMIGTIGCPTADRDIPAHYVFEGGGNIDSQKITKGTTLYIPVRVPGGLLAMGDMHATMGDGEMVGTGIEIGGRIRCRIGLIKGFALNWPVTETRDAWYVNTCGETCDQAIERGYHEMHRLLKQSLGWDATDTAMYMSMQGYLEACQACLSPRGGGNSFRIGTPKLPGQPLLPAADFGR